MGVPIEGPCHVFCDDSAVVINAKNSESILTKDHEVINYHCSRVKIAAKTIQVNKEDTTTNLADLLTKCNTGPTLKNFPFKGDDKKLLEYIKTNLKLHLCSRSTVL